MYFIRICFFSDDNEQYEMAHLSSKTTPEKLKRQREPPNVLSKDSGKKPEDGDMKRPWQTLVSYVDELTVGGRKTPRGSTQMRWAIFQDLGARKRQKYHKIVILVNVTNSTYIYCASTI